MKNPLGASSSKGNQGMTQDKKFFGLGGNQTHDIQIRCTTALPTKLQGWTEKVGMILGGESR